MNNIHLTPKPSNSGTYTGDSSANRAIAHGLGRIPSLVLLVSNDVNFTYIVNGLDAIIHPTDGAHYHVTAMDANYFYVGNAANYTDSDNLNLAVIYWAAM